MSHHAYCIIVHTDLYCLQKFIEYINDEKNDIIILFGQKN